MAKNLVSGTILVHLAEIRAANLFIYFFQKSGSSVTRYHGQLSSCTISEKINDPVLRKLSDVRTDGQTDESDFIGHCLTNAERLKIFRKKKAICFCLKKLIYLVKLFLPTVKQSSSLDITFIFFLP